MWRYVLELIAFVVRYITCLCPSLISSLVSNTSVLFIHILLSSSSKIFSSQLCKPCNISTKTLVIVYEKYFMERNEFPNYIQALFSALGLGFTMHLSAS